MTGLGTALVIIVGGLHVVDGQLTLGGLLVFLSYLMSLYVPIETLAYVSASYDHGRGRRPTGHGGSDPARRC